MVDCHEFTIARENYVFVMTVWVVYPLVKRGNADDFVFLIHAAEEKSLPPSPKHYWLEVVDQFATERGPQRCFLHLLRDGERVRELIYRHKYDTSERRARNIQRRKQQVADPFCKDDISDVWWVHLKIATAELAI